VDLSDATWNFPFSLQAQVLRAIGGGRLLEFFELPISDDGLFIEVKKGQAMGLNPSFPLFGLTHNLLLVGLCRYIGCNPVDTFRVLGDDVVIADRRVRDLYLEFARDYNVPISDHKCLNGDAAEFAGKIILKGVDITPIRWTMLGGTQLPALFHSYRSIIGDSVYRLISDREAFYVLGALPKVVGGLGIQGFDLVHPVTARHLKQRIGLVKTRTENLGLPPMKGEVIKLPQGDLSPQPEQGIWKFMPDYLRMMGGLLDVGKEPNPWGELPYLGKPGRVSRQLGVDIPLMPSLRRSNKPTDLAQTYVRRYSNEYRDKRHRRRSELREILRLCYEEYLSKRESVFLTEEAKTPKKSQGAPEVEEFLDCYVPTLFYDK
jgi:hypothetical protein